MQSDIAERNAEYIIFASDFDLPTTKQFLQSRNIEYKQLKGKYKGVEEDSFIINKDNAPLINPLIKNQESTLYRGKICYSSHNKRRKTAARLFHNNK